MALLGRSLLNNQHFLIISLLFLISNSAFALYTGSDNTAAKADSEKPTQIIVKFKDSDVSNRLNAAKSGIATGLSSFDSINDQYKVQSIRPLTVKSSKSSVHDSFRNVYIIRPLDGEKTDELITQYSRLSYVEYAEPDYPVSLHLSPNDSLYSHLYSLNNTGQEHLIVQRNYGNSNDEQVLVTGVPDADIDADEVYQDIPDNTITVVVAVVDTGVDIDHPDLAGSIWNNNREMPNNGIDDDNNGYIDDTYGWDFASSIDPLDPGDPFPTDNFGHGTHVAGTIAAVINNGIGIAGIATDCKIMALSFDPLPLTSRIVNSILYAADNGADVINMSFGLTYRSDILKEAIEYADAKGVVLCASSGNSGNEEYSYPAGYLETITVGSSNDSDYVSTFSTYGDHLTICAPGEGILSLRAGTTDMYGSRYPYERDVHIVADQYYIASGTSMSCPHAVGVSAQLRSLSPGLTPLAVRQILTSTADDIVDPYGVGWNLPSWDRHAGYGRVNYFNAVNAVPKVRALIDLPPLNSIVSGDAYITGIADGDDFVNYRLEYGDGDLPTEWNLIRESSTPITYDIITQWPTEGMNGRYTLRLTSGEKNIAYRSLYIINETAATINYPSNGDTISNFILLSGDAYAPDFRSYRIEYRSLIDSTWIEVGSGSTPMFDERLGGWFLEGLTEGDYYVKLTVTHKDESFDEDSILVHVLSIFSTENAWKTNIGAYPAIISTYGDFDGDGANEIVFANSSDIDFYNLDGSLKTSGVPDFPPNNYMIMPAVGSLDKDGIDDIVAIGYNPPMLYGYPSSDTAFRYYLGEFPDITNYFETEHDFPKLFLKDINSDGLDEIHFFNQDRELSTTYVFKPNGTLINSYDYYAEYLSADLNNDGIDEVYTANRSFCLLRQIDPFNGTVKDSLLIDKNGSSFKVAGMSAVDIDNDRNRELILFGYYSDFGYYIYALNDELEILEGWPHEMNIDDYVVPTMPVFGDIDGDYKLEYLSTFFDITASYILAWNIDGTPYFPDNEDGLFTVTPEPAVMNMLLLADMNSDGMPDIVACADNDMFNTFQAQRIYAWDNEARLLSGFPIITLEDAYTNERFTPTIGDINKDGFVDMIMSTPDSSGMFINIEGAIFDTSKSPAPHWRYNRRMNNMAPLAYYGNPTDVTENDGAGLPNKYTLQTNYPNPFNSTTQIRFSLAAKAEIKIEIYNLLGQVVKTVENNTFAAGNYTVSWDGTDQNNNEVATGIYLYSLKTGDLVQTRKMVFLK